MLHSISFYSFKFKLTKWEICLRLGRWIWVSSHYPLTVLKAGPGERQVPARLNFSPCIQLFSLPSALWTNSNFRPTTWCKGTVLHRWLSLAVPLPAPLQQGMHRRDFSQAPIHLSDFQFPRFLHNCLGLIPKVNAWSCNTHDGSASLTDTDTRFSN